MPAPILKTRRLHLSPFAISDAADVFEYASNPEVAKYVTWEAHPTIEDSKYFIRLAIETQSTKKGGTFWVWAIRLAGKAIGSIQFIELNEHEGQVDFALSQEHWKKGFMSECLKSVVEWGFINHPNMIQIRALALPDNIGSQKLQEKVGFQYKETLKNHLVIRGSPRDLERRVLMRRNLY